VKGNIMADQPQAGVKLVGATVATIAVLRRLCAGASPLSLAEIAKPLALNRSTAFNILRTLAHEGVVHFDPAAKTYAVTNQLIDLVRGVSHQPRDRIHVLREGMAQVAGLYQVNVAHWVIHGDRLVLSAVAESPAEIKLTQLEGQRIPLLHGAVGRAVAAALPMPDEEISRRFATTAWRKPQDLGALTAAIRQARRRGWADDGGAAPPGTRAIAVALRDEDGVVDGGCAALMFAGQYDAEGEAAIAAALRTIAGE